MSQNIRGWRKINGAMLEQTAARWPQSHQHNVGFRLVHDNVDQACRGGSWFDSDGAGEAYRHSEGPRVRTDYFSFRLVWGRS